MRFLVPLMLCFAFGLNGWSKSNYDVVSRHIIYYEYDSAYVKLRDIKEPYQREILAKIIFGFASYQDYISFLDEAVFFSRNDYQNLVYFLESSIKPPQSKSNVDLKYVILQSKIIDILANRLEFTDAVKYSDALNLYLDQIKNKTELNFQLAQLYNGTFEALFGAIEVDMIKLEKARQNMDLAFKLGDTLLGIQYAIMVPSLYIENNDLEGYVSFYLDKLKIAKSFKGKHLLYDALVDKLLDGLIYADYPDRGLIEEMLFYLHDSPRYHYLSYYCFLRYFKAILNDEEKMQGILERLGYPDLVSMLQTLRNELPSFLSENDLGFFYLSSSRLLFDIEEYRLSIEYMYAMVLSRKQTYSRDLTDAIANYKVRNLEQEQKLVLAQEKEKNEIYFNLGIAISILLLFTILLAFLLARRTRVLNKRNLENEKLIEEKDLLMQEIHHRVKNNFELVNALLELQGAEVDNIEAKEKLHEGQARIQSLSLIHHKLYESNQSTSVEMNQYIEELALLILKSTDLQNNVVLEVRADNVQLDIDTAVPIGLIINELITNSCKYAFQDQGVFGLNIGLNVQEDSTFKLTYKELGVLFKESAQKGSPKGLGKILITNLVKQLKGKLVSDFSEGAHYEIWFKDKLNRKKTE